jgi:hypothetical protein
VPTVAGGARVTLDGMKLVLVAILLSASACTAAQSALGAIAGGSKPQPITIVNEVNGAPREEHAAAKAVAGGALAGAVVGGLATAALRGTSTAEVATGALVGAGVGTAIGFVVHEIAD